MKRGTAQTFSWPILAGLLFCISPLFAEDTPVTRGTLANLRGVSVVAERIQPNIQKYAAKAGLDAARMQKAIENRLQAAGIRTMSGDDWLRAPGRPVLYVNINTHEMDKFWYAYDIKLELRQIVSMEAYPKVKTLADTWSINITGITHIGNLKLIRMDSLVLLERFIEAYKSVNRQREGK